MDVGRWETVNVRWERGMLIIQIMTKWNVKNKGVSERCCKEGYKYWKTESNLILVSNG